MHATGLAPGAKYALLRYDGYEQAPADSRFKGSNYTHAEPFVADATGAYVWTDTTKISSDKSVYYYVLKAGDI